jgi:SAM-dependent methyltransferase
MIHRTAKATKLTACRHCGGKLSIPFCDLGSTPLANAYPAPDKGGATEPRFPLNAVVCERCFLVQLDHVVDASAIFSEYAYFSSYSSSWLSHAARYVEDVSARLKLGAKSLVVEVGSNDGYLLRNFVARGIPCLGVEPAANVSEVAEKSGVPTLTRFFGLEVAREIRVARGPASLVIANNVLAHVPDINDFVRALAHLVGDTGVVSIEAPHLLTLVEGIQFDTIYHEHYAYWSLHAMSAVFATHGLAVFDVERIATHGGSLRVFAAASAAGREASAAVDALRAEEARVGVTTRAYYDGFESHVRAVVNGFRDWLRDRLIMGHKVGAYGAAAKGNTFLNAAEIGVENIGVVADANPAKQGKLLPGSRIPVVAPDELIAQRPDDIVILPWNLANEIAADLVGRGHRGGIWVAVPAMREVTPRS